MLATRRGVTSAAFGSDAGITNENWPARSILSVLRHDIKDVIGPLPTGAPLASSMST
jgi:hypothetical protein